jgi:Zn-dependent peptidase ImmA (M78 family)
MHYARSMSQTVCGLTRSRSLPGNDIILKQQWYRDYLLEQGSPRLAFAGRFSIRDATEEVAENIRGVLHIDASLRENCNGWDEFLAAIVRNAEASGMLVMRSGIVASNTHRRLSVEEFRGFAISDPIAPLAIINASDSRSAQIFTVAHEIAHVWLGRSGISNENLGDPEIASNNAVERFCNAVAAEVLAPAADFSDLWDESRPLEENVTIASRHFKVSRVVILRRALDLGRISRKQYAQQYEREMQTSRGTSGTKGGHFYRTTLARNSPTFTNAVVQGTLVGHVLYRDAARLLNVGVPAVQKIADYLAKNGNAM